MKDNYHPLATWDEDTWDEYMDPEDTGEDYAPDHSDAPQIPW